MDKTSITEAIAMFLVSIAKTAGRTATAVKNPHSKVAQTISKMVRVYNAGIKNGFVAIAVGDKGSNEVLANAGNPIQVEYESAIDGSNRSTLEPQLTAILGSALRVVKGAGAGTIVAWSDITHHVGELLGRIDPKYLVPTQKGQSQADNLLHMMLQGSTEIAISPTAGIERYTAPGDRVKQLEVFHESAKGYAKFKALPSWDDIDLGALANPKVTVEGVSATDYYSGTSLADWVRDCDISVSTIGRVETLPDLEDDDDFFGLIG
tara:strand:- start:208 stop:999 length:792 start_codon:yes stop_codon:yes gene_type:complete